MAETVGSLLVRLGLDSGAFRSGLDVAEKEFRSVQKRFEGIGKKIAGVGKTVTLGVTAPLAAIGAAGAAAAGELAKSVPELEKLAQISGTGFEEFQRLAYAARSVGIEGDKLGDILKDVNDKIGDFQSTGGGAMKDFFEQIGPKVGVTAEAFKNLSGADALQLYYNSLKKAGVSQAEMTFYMEALASDATALAPLLEDNGKAMKEMGANAAVIGAGDVGSLKAYVEAQRQMGEAFKKLTIAVVNSGLLDAVTGFVTKVADFASRLSKTNPQLLQFAVGFGAVAAAVGPLVTMFGGLVQIMAPLLAAFSLSGAAAGASAAGTAAAGTAAAGASTGFAALAAAAAPWIAGAAAVAGAGYLIYKNWDKIAPVLNDLWQTVSETLGPPLQEIVSTVTTMMSELWNGPFGDAIREAGSRLATFGKAVLDTLGPVLLGALKLVFQQIGNVLKALLDFGRAIGSLFDGDIIGAFRNLGSAINNLFGGLPAKVIGWIAEMVRGIGQWMGAKLNAIWDGVKKKVDAVTGWFRDMYVAVVGNSFVPDMVDEIGQHMRRLDKELVDPARKATGKAAEAFRALQEEVADILARLFPEQAARITFDKERAALDAYHKAGKLSADAHAAAVEALKREYLGLDRDRAALTPGQEAPGITLSEGSKSIEEMVREAQGRFVDVMTNMKDQAQITKVSIVQTFEEMAQGVLDAVDQLAGAIKGGGFLNILRGVIGLGLQLGKTGLFGSKIQTSLLTPIAGARALGGPVMSGRPYLVGEKGPELFTPRSSGRITPNNELGGGRVEVRIVPTPYFDAHVDGRASVQVARAAPGIASAGAAGGLAQMQRKGSRRLA